MGKSPAELRAIIQRAKDEAKSAGITVAPATLTAQTAAPPIAVPSVTVDEKPKSKKQIKKEAFKASGAEPKKKKTKSCDKADNKINVRGRLPHNSTFSAKYDATRNVWTGTMNVSVRVTHCDMTAEFTGEGGGLFRMLESLDNQYRTWYAKEVAPIKWLSSQPSQKPKPAESPQPEEPSDAQEPSQPPSQCDPS